MIYDVRKYGAVAKDEILNTISFQKAIDDCYQNGGGRVLVAGGKYKIGSITLKSNVELHIAADGVILGSEKCEDYPEKQNLKHIITENLPRKRNASLIFAEESENISITGMGKIDCNGTSFVYEKQGEINGWRYDRIDAPTPPRVVFFTGCKNIKVEDVTMINQPSGWSYWIHDCDYVSFRKCKIFAEVQYPNNDGIHINSSRNVTISDCNITCGDDCIVIRANNLSLKENKTCEKVTVTNCNLTSYANCIRIAWLNDGTIKNCTFSNIVMTDSSNGIALKLPNFNPDLADKGREDTLIENLNFQNIVMDGIYGRPIKIIIADSRETRCKAIRNISFSNIRARGLEYPYIYGRKDCEVKNISFNNCSFERVSDETLPNYKHHGAAAWNRTNESIIMIKCAQNVVFNNTSFNSEV